MFSRTAVHAKQNAEEVFVEAMTLHEFRTDKGRCAAMRRTMEMDFFKKFIEAVFTDLELQESLALEKNLGTDNPNVELRLQNRRKGHTDFLAAMKMCCEPEITAEMPPEEYGAGEEAARMLDHSGWLTMEP